MLLYWKNCIRALFFDLLWLLWLVRANALFLQIYSKSIYGVCGRRNRENVPDNTRSNVHIDTKDDKIHCAKKSNFKSLKSKITEKATVIEIDVTISCFVWNGIKSLNDLFKLYFFKYNMQRRHLNQLSLLTPPLKKVQEPKNFI